MAGTQIIDSVTGVGTTAAVQALSSKPTVWLTGLSGAGKTTIATALSALLRVRGERVEVLDGADIREELGDFFGYSREERMKVNRVLCSMARLLARHDVVPIVTAITPYQESRDFNRRELGTYLEIYVDCPVDVCVARDRTGLYRKAMRGDLKHVVGVDDPYEVPRHFDLRIASAEEGPHEAAVRVAELVARTLALRAV